LDLSYVAIRAMELIGLAWRVRVPARERIVSKSDHTSANRNRVEMR
jgi:hypothetical protein